MTYSRSILVENLLARPEMHRKWEGDYRTTDNESFYEAAFDFIAGLLAPCPGATFLDVGCGSCAHSVRLARRHNLSRLNDRLRRHRHGRRLFLVVSITAGEEAVFVGT